MSLEDREQSRRHRSLARLTHPDEGRRNRDAWRGQEAAIYCRISHVRDEDQTGVDRQERICLATAERLGLIVNPKNIFIDNNRSAWTRDRKRPGWDALLAVMRKGITHVIAYHPDRLMRQPRDLEELLTISDEHGITLHGEANRRDLSDPDDRFFLRIEVAHACRSSDDTSRRVKATMLDRARDGKPKTGGKRRYGYAPNAVDIIPEEAKVIRWIFESFLDGMTPFQMMEDLNRRGVKTAQGKLWRINTLLNVIDSTHVASIMVFRGKQIGKGTWPAIIDEGMWREAQERRTFRSAAFKETHARTRFYLLRGIVYCSACGRLMVGRSMNDGRPVYMCGSHRNPDKSTRCFRSIGAITLESFVKDAAIDLLERLDITGRERAAILSEEDEAAIEAEQAELSELKDMWDSREIDTAEYREMRKAVEKRIKKIQDKTIVRPAVEVLAGMVGPDAHATWEALEQAGKHERLNAVLRFLFAAIRIKAADTPANGVFDYGRIDIDQNDL
ncbi:recombinase family protein [Nonomuraea africana]|uniref:DNA invertase Pin-like site-specific DNA recombinase n=1 Tax=Nonomuraea africana TaxID=46171 RepID=A0ABR9KWB3_9ACTN|nr:recombinase family protein [Nonomuraea africana]MBE1566309.1 DNA invertase Pin-like site-specific DNA recombinase [Nonomuraea africana]